MSNKIILALDQASKTSGYAVFIDNKLSSFGKFTYEDVDIDAKLVKIRNKVQELINTYHPTEILYEDIQLQESSGVTTYKVLAEVIGVLSELFSELDIKHQLVHSQTWKSTLGIKGKNRTEQKRNAQKYVLEHFKDLDHKPTQDECDAICIGAHYIAQSVNDWSD